MSGWRVATSLLVLRDQINDLWPNRDRSSDGTIGDAAHQNEVSDHNPDYLGIVRALDITHDPVNGCDIDALTDALAASRDSRISYVIANRLIMFGLDGENPWTWHAYSGSDPHTGHVHISVVDTDIADNDNLWDLSGLGAQMASMAEQIAAMMMGLPNAGDGSPICPTRWQIATEKWQANVSKQLDELKALVTKPMSDAQVSTIADLIIAAIIERDDYVPLSVDDQPTIVEAVKKALREGTAS